MGSVENMMRQQYLLERTLRNCEDNEYKRLLTKQIAVIEKLLESAYNEAVSPEAEMPKSQSF